MQYSCFIILTVVMYYLQNKIGLSISFHLRAYAVKTVTFFHILFVVSTALTLTHNFQLNTHNLYGSGSLGYFNELLN